MKFRRTILLWAVVIVSVFLVIRFSIQARYDRLRPQTAKYADFIKTPPVKINEVGVFIVGEKIFHEFIGAIDINKQNLFYSPSGPPAYIFDPHGNLIDYSLDIGDDTRYVDKWHRNQWNRASFKYENWRSDFFGRKEAAVNTPPAELDPAIPEKAVVTIEMEIPPLGKSVGSAPQPFPGGTFSVETLAYLKGNDVGVASGASGLKDLAEGERVFEYGNKYFSVTAGENHVLVIICKAEFTDGIPDLFKKREVWDGHLQLAVTDEKGESLGSGINSADDVGSSRYYVLGKVNNAQFPEKIRVRFFSDMLEKQAFKARETNISAEKAAVIAKEYVESKGINVADYEAPDVTFKELDNVWEVSFNGKDKQNAYLAMINGETGEVATLLEYETFENGKMLKRFIQ